MDPMSTYSTATDAPPSTKEYIREVKARSMSYGKNFAVVGMMFAGIECMVESVSTIIHVSAYIGQLGNNRQVSVLHMSLSFFGVGFQYLME